MLNSTDELQWRGGDGPRKTVFKTDRKSFDKVMSRTDNAYSALLSSSVVLFLCLMYKTCLRLCALLLALQPLVYPDNFFQSFCHEVSTCD